MKAKTIYKTLECKESECFACKKGYCQILTDNNFNGKKCPFFKTQKEINEFNAMHPELMIKEE